MKIKLRYLALGLVALFGSLLASSQHISAYAATDRLSSSSAAGATVLGTSNVPPEGASAAPKTLATSFLYLPLVMRPVEGIFGYLTQGGIPVPSIWLDLRFYNGSSWSTAATTTTNSSGYYLFTGIPALAAGQLYYVRYWNSVAPNSDDPSRLGIWASRDVTSYSVGSSVSLGTSDLANVNLVAPSPGLTVSLPQLFQWTPRPATPSDSYRLALFRLGTSLYARTVLLGYVSDFYMTSLPSGFSPNVKYYWSVELMDSNGGAGAAYWLYAVTFSNSGASVSGPLNMALQTTGRPKDLPPHLHLKE